MIFMCVCVCVCVCVEEDVFLQVAQKQMLGWERMCTWYIKDIVYAPGETLPAWGSRAGKGRSQSRELFQETFKPQPDPTGTSEVKILLASLLSRGRCWLSYSAPARLCRPPQGDRNSLALPGPLWLDVRQLQELMAAPWTGQRVRRAGTQSP